MMNDLLIHIFYLHLETSTYSKIKTIIYSALNNPHISIASITLYKSCVAKNSPDTEYIVVYNNILKKERNFAYCITLKYECDH